MPVRIHLHDTNDAWKTRALCFTGGYHPDLWFPDSYRSEEGRAQARIAASICHRCPVFEQCLASVTSREGTSSLDRRDGIWAATTPDDRYNAVKHAQKIRRQQLAAAA